MNELLWYVTRASAGVALALLTASLVLGMLTAGRTAPLGSPSSAAGAAVRTALHRSLSLVMVVFVALHVVTVVAESYVDVGWLSALVPFTSTYDRFWVGLGTLAVDVLIAITVTSLLRHRISTRAWKLVHWSAYALWPIALAHGLGASTSDGVAVTVLAAVCAIAVVVAGAWRLRAVDVDARRRRLVAASEWR